MPMHSKRSLEGYYLVDHRASPGLPTGFMTGLGFNAPSVAGGAMMECPTITCCHCNTVVIVNPHRTRARNHCRKCDAYVCDNPACNAECTPFSQILDDAEKQALRADASSQQSTGFVLRKG